MNDVNRDAAGIESRVVGLCRAARTAAPILAGASTAAKNAALRGGAAALRANQARLLAANAEDVAQAHAEGAASAFVDRLTLTPARIEQLRAQLAPGAEHLA